MQIDETDILTYIVYNSWTTAKVYNETASRFLYRYEAIEAP